MDNPAAIAGGNVLTSPPKPARDLALFLDLDGTLLDIAPTPAGVVVPPDLIPDLRAVAIALNGAVAIVSGRDLGEIDHLLDPLRLPGGGEHGAVVRLADGTLDEIDIRVPRDWTHALAQLQATCPGVLTELKPHNVVAHFRNAPIHAAAVRRLAEELVAHDPETFELLEAKMAVEIRPRTITKGRVVHRLMEKAPFRGRTPVFIGDDVTDEDGFAAALAHGGLALEVGTRFSGEPREVRAWLKRFADL